MAGGSKANASAPRIKTPVQKRSRERVDRILLSTARLLASRDPKEVSIRAIATEAEVSPGTIYQFFRDKEAIFEALSERFSTAILERCEEDLTVELVRNDLGRFVAQLMITIDEVQQEHEGFVCVLRGTEQPSLEALTTRVRGEIMALLDRQFARAYPETPEPDRRFALSLFETTFMALMVDFPAKGTQERLTYGEAVRDIVLPFLKKRFRPPPT